MGPRRTWYLRAAVAVVLGLILWRFVLRPQADPHRFGVTHGGGAPAAAASAPGGAPGGSPPGTGEPSRLADGLNAPASDVHEDLREIDAIFNAYRGAVRLENPVGENAEITAALTGRNKLGFAFIPRDCPALNAKGELCDRWGTPYFFHQLSGERMEIRSAGPDRRLWTADDEVLTP